MGCIADLSSERPRYQGSESRIHSNGRQIKSESGVRRLRSSTMAGAVKESSSFV